MSKEMTAREFMKTMEGLINSPNQKLIGDMRGGYVYLSLIHISEPTRPY